MSKTIPLKIASDCTSCTRRIEVGQTFVGLPIVRLISPEKSQMTGMELLFHVPCFMHVTKQPLSLPAFADKK